MINKINQSGRSMVEMLGVLAIIGVLSVGGIAGYTTAMNKHKANEILNAASVRAMVVSTQIQNGSSSPTLAEFTDNKVAGATFGTDVKNTAGTGTWVKGTDTKFSLTLSGVDTKVCDQMKNIAGESSIIKAWGDNCTLLTYNNDLGEEKVLQQLPDLIAGEPCENPATVSCRNGKLALCIFTGTYDFPIACELGECQDESHCKTDVLTAGTFCKDSTRYTCNNPPCYYEPDQTFNTFSVLEQSPCPCGCNDDGTDCRSIYDPACTY